MIENFFHEELEKTVFISAEQMADVSKRALYGRYYEDSRIFNIFPEALNARGDFLCEVLTPEETPAPEETPVPEETPAPEETSGQESGRREEGLRCIAKDGGLTFYFDGKQLKTEVYELYQSIFSRNKGILETDAMAEKKAVILGCGSVGSLVAMELARAGVGSFLLADPDIVEYHNICRHQCGIEDVGDLKIHALERKLKNINPNVKIYKFEGIVQNLPKQMLDEFCTKERTIFVGCADNREADVYANRISIYYSAYFISIGFWERAYAGEIFYHIPGKGMPCYGCALGDGGTISARAQANHHLYSNQELTEGMKFEPGISADINFITTIGIKLILDLLNSKEEGYIPRLLNHLQQYTVVCNTSDPRIGGEMVEIFSYPLQVTTSLAVCFRREECRENGACRHEMEE